MSLVRSSTVSSCSDYGHQLGIAPELLHKKTALIHPDVEPLGCRRQNINKIGLNFGQDLLLVALDGEPAEYRYDSDQQAQTDDGIHAEATRTETECQVLIPADSV